MVKETVWRSESKSKYHSVLYDGGMTRRGSYAKGIAKREEILTVALDVIARHGYRGASVREIADAVGLSQAGLLHYFDSRDELLTAVLTKRDEVDAPAPAEEPFEALLRIVAHNAEVPGLVQLYAQLSIEATDPAHPAHEYFVARYERLRSMFADGIRRAQAAGAMRADADPETTATAIVAAADGLQAQFLLDPSIDMATGLRALIDGLRL